MTSFVKHMLGNVRRNREQRPGVQTTNGRPVGGGGCAKNDGIGRHCRPDSSSAHATSSESAAVSEAVTKQSFGEHLLRAMRERRAMHNKTKLRELARKWQKECETNTTDVSKQVETKKTELFALYRLYLSDRGVSPGPLSTSNAYMKDWSTRIVSRET